MPKVISTNNSKVKSQQTAIKKLWCLLIGVGEYQDKTFRPLSYALADCQGLAKAFKQANQNFVDTEIIEHNFQTLQKPYLSDIRANLQQIVTSANSEDTILFYFSGHGMLDSKSQQAVLCLTDTQTDDLLNTGLVMQELLQMLGNCQASQQLVVLDACHSGSLTLRNSPTPQLVEELQQVAVQKKQTGHNQGFYALLSCDKEQESWEFPELSHGVFTYFLIRGLLGEAADSRGEIEIKTLYKYIYHQTLQYIDKLNQGLRLINLQKRSRGETDGFKKEQPPQTPKLIVEAVGELILGYKTSEVQPRSLRQALIVDGLSNRELPLAISKILSSAGGFDLKYWHPQVRDLPDIRQAIQNCLLNNQSEVFLEDVTSLLYLRGRIEETETGEAFLVLNDEIKLSRDWLRQHLRQSNIAQQIVILDCLVKETESIPSLQDWLEDLQQELEFSQCLIIGAAKAKNSAEFPTALLNTLQKANLQTGLSVAGWITGVQRELAESKIWRNYWLGGVQGVIEVIPAASQQKSQRLDLGICPYMGLKAFSEKDAQYFYGQEALTQKIINEVNQKSFLAIVGASGSGKSSVVQAGLMAQLRLGKQLPTSEQWWIKCLRTGENPIAELAQIMADGEENPLQTEGLLHLGGEGFVRWLRTRTEPMVVLVIDQFEELFTLAAASDRQLFLDILLEALEYAADRFKLVITLRADFIASCLEVPLLSKKLQESHVLVPPRLTEENYRQVIEKPAQQVELKVQSGLVELLLQDLQQSAGDLPLLQFVLEQLWEHRDQNTGELTVKAYREQIGGIQSALERKSQAVYDSLAPEEKIVAQWIFLSLTRLGEGTEDTKRQVRKSNLFEGKYSPVIVESTLQKFIAAKLIVVKLAEDESNIGQSRTNDEITEELQLLKSEVTVEVAHEILIHHWSTLRWWLDENRDRLHQQQRLEKKVKEWQAKNKHPDFLLQKTQLTEAEAFYHKYKDEIKPQEREYIQASKQARLKSRLLIGSVSTISLLLIVSSGIVAWQQQQQNQLAQLIRYGSFNIMTPDIAKSTLKSLPTLLKNADTHQHAGDVNQALDDYRQILLITHNLQEKVTQEPKIFTDINNHQYTIQQASQKAENSIAVIIKQYQIPQLEAELKQGNFGDLVITDLSKLENQYTGALKISYAILMGKQGANADMNNDGYLTEGEEKNLPCQTLKDIEDLWRKYTQNRCSLNDVNDSYQQPACKELQGQNLTIKLSFPPSAYLLKRRWQQCQSDSKVMQQ
ncbi:caspase family protein [Nostoc sp. CENA67]|uniref:Caspase family protein n=1 Tax=Amazonocrinis nigriterrae CENA67 TaxID=2794033 RepID=A0A8J7L6M8_9NOST|nr:caspase family protein [Amazonocrinis nigriterrae]MBH8562459.1 caspase family protein [Amazonocrinis nigriterrae CENA67]